MVKIKAGRFTGHTGRVLRSGNGWVQLQTAMGEVAKRAYELQLLPASEQNKQPSGPSGDSEKSRKRNRSGGMKEATAASGNGGSSGGGDSSSNSSATHRDRGGSGSSNAANIAAAAAAAKASAATAAAAASGKASAAAKSTSSTATSPTPDSSASKTRPINIEDDDKDADDKPKKRFALGASAGRNRRNQSTAAAQRIAESRSSLERYQEHIRKHLERQMEKAKERPNLNWWLKEFKAGADSAIEETVSEPRHNEVFDIGPPTCDSCSLDLLQGFTFCWNEACVESPIFQGLRDAARKYQAEVEAEADGATGGDAGAMDVEQVELQSTEELKVIGDKLDSYLLDAPSQWLDGKRRVLYISAQKELVRKAALSPAARKKTKSKGKGKNVFTPANALDDNRDALIYRWHCSQQVDAGAVAAAAAAATAAPAPLASPTSAKPKPKLPAGKPAVTAKPASNVALPKAATAQPPTQVPVPVNGI
mmetsp:Transcript_23638/g.74312  ORF Transcript_23638/g.74312 Transcript_23638/m.74312 type:complete len:479 (+) Transcript_23638:677-2113(+)